MKREENELMREKILDAFITCKLEVNGANVSHVQVASRAGISERTLNRYFPDKDMLNFFAAVRYMRQITEAFSELFCSADLSDKNGLERLIYFLRLEVNSHEQNIARAKVFVRAYTIALRTALTNNLLVSDYDEKIRETVTACIAAGIDDGSIRRELDPYKCYILITSNYLGMMQRLVYCDSVVFEDKERKDEFFSSFNNYIDMLEEYLSTDGRKSRS